MCLNVNCTGFCLSIFTVFNLLLKGQLLLYFIPLFGCRNKNIEIPVIVAVVICNKYSDALVKKLQLKDCTFAQKAGFSMHFHCRLTAYICSVLWHRKFSNFRCYNFWKFVIFVLHGQYVYQMKAGTILHSNLT